MGVMCDKRPTTNLSENQNSGRGIPQVDQPTSTMNPVGATREGSPIEHRIGSPRRWKVPLKVEEHTSVAKWWLRDQL